MTDRGSARRFHSKIDGLFYGCFAVSVGLPFALGLSEFRDGHWLLLGLAAALAVLLVSLAATTYYVVDDQALTVQCLLRKTVIPLASITALRPTHNPLSSPALSLDRLEVTYTGGLFGYALVSPKDKAGFIEAIRHAQPAASVTGSTEGPSRVVWILIAAAIGPAAIVLAVSYAGGRPPTIVVTPSALTVGGTFGTSVPMRDVVGVSLEEQMPRVVRKRVGLDGFTALRGRFELEGLGDGHLYVQRSARPYVLIRTRDSFVYINYSDSARTQLLFDQVKRAQGSSAPAF